MEKMYVKKALYTMSTDIKQLGKRFYRIQDDCLSEMDNSSQLILLKSQPQDKKNLLMAEIKINIHRLVNMQQ